MNAKLLGNFQQYIRPI